MRFTLRIMQHEDLSDVIAESIASLELPGVLEEVAAHALSTPGKEEVLGLQPEESLGLVREHLELVTQFKEITGTHGALGLGGLIPMEGVFDKLQNPSAVLDSEEILAVADTLAIGATTRDRLESLDDRFELLREQAKTISSLHHLKSRITSILDEHGLVRSTASPRLMEIHERTRSVRENIQKRLERIIEDRDLSRIVQEDYVTMRNDRYVILLRPEFKGLLEGIVHDHSRSGASVYVEPFHVVALNNQIASMIDEEREEVRRIFVELTKEIRLDSAEIAQTYHGLARLDAFQARALYAVATSAVTPVLVEQGFQMIGARHPLLPEAEVVPMDVVQSPSTSATIISGANMGGKTVALKIAGLFPLMTRCGILLPAREGTEVQPFTRVMADIGEEQDIRGHVSSFSGHMLRMKTILEDAGPGDLVLLDELGGATDPDEGSALAMAIVDELMERGAKTVVTTHLTHLKAYALSKPGVKNVSVEFHPQTLKPTFRLIYDLPGESHAIATAERIGLPAKVMNRARSYVDKAAGGGSRLIENLREKLADVERLQTELERKQRGIDEELETIRSNRETAVEEFRKEAQEMLKRAEKQIVDLQQSLKSGKMRTGPKPQKVLAELKQDIVTTLGRPLEKQVDLPPIGSRVRLKTLGREGTIKDILDRGRVEIALGGLTVRADVEDLVLLSQGSGKKSSSKIKQIGVDMSPANPRWEVNVIGFRVDEALPVVEKALDEALLGGLPSLTIIHGKGTGRLKKAIWEYLTGHSLVKEFHAGEVRFGGAGITVVELVAE
jgi:DNA mismatch repair protein MutS2